MTEGRDALIESDRKFAAEERQQGNGETESEQKKVKADRCLL